MLNFVHDIPTRLYFGEGQISHLTEALGRFGKRVLLTYGGGSIKKTGLYGEVTKLLADGGFTVTELSGIEPNPRIGSVEKGVGLCREHGIDVILAVGGGSTIDCCKAISVGACTDQDFWKTFYERGEAAEKALPLEIGRAHV